MQTITLDALWGAIKALEERISVLSNQLQDRYIEEQEFKSEDDLIKEIGTITKQQAADLLQVSYRHLLRYKNWYDLKTVRVGREIHFYLVPIITAIRKYKLPWCEKTYERIRQSQKRLPKI